MDVHARTRSEPDARAHSHGMPDVVPDGKGCCTTAGNRRGTAGRLFSGAFSCVADLLAMSALSRIQDFIIEYANQNLHIHLIQTI